MGKAVESCKYHFVKWAGERRGEKNMFQGERTGGAIFATSCGNTVYGLELTKGNCIFCGNEIEVEK